MRQYKWVLVNILNNKDLDVLVVNEIHFFKLIDKSKLDIMD